MSDPSVEQGFTQVDAQPDPAFLVRTMDATSHWPAVRRLRAFERARLAPSPGDRILDVGCGLADVAIEMAALVQPGGHVLAVDASEEFLDVARHRADASSTPIELRVEDATALDVDDAAVDIVRSERMLQWLPDMRPAVYEMVRVLRPGGRLCLTDTDWRTLVFDLPDPSLSQAVVDGVVAFRGPSSHAGGRLLNLMREAGVTDIECRADTHVWTVWDAENEDGRAGFFPLGSTVRQLAEQGHLDHDVAERFVEAAYRAARDGRYYMALSMTAVFGRRPG